MELIATFNFLQIILNGINAAVVYYYFKTILRYRENLNRKLIKTMYVLFGALQLVFSYVPLSSFQRLGLLFLSVFALSLLCQGGLGSKLAYSVLFIGATLLLDLLSGVAVVTFSSDLSLATINDSPWVGSLATFIASVLLFVLIRVIGIFATKKRTKLSPKYLTIIISLPLSCITAAYTMGRLAVETGGNNFLGMLNISFLGLFIAIVAVFSIIEDKFTSTEKYQAALAAEQKNQFTRDSYKELDLHHKTTLSIRHEMENNFLILREMVRSGKYKDALALIDKLVDSMVKLDSVVKTGMVVLDLIITLKYYDARKKGIQVDLDIQFDEKPAVPYSDLCSISINSMNNAIEACDKNKSPDNKAIKFIMRCENGIFTIRTQNPTERKVRIVDGLIATTKKDKRRHGLGLIAIEDICRKYGGDMKLRYEKPVFTCEMTLRNTEN